MIKRTKMGSIRFPEGGKGPFEGNASAEPPPDLAASQGIPINCVHSKKTLDSLFNSNPASRPCAVILRSPSPSPCHRPSISQKLFMPAERSQLRAQHGTITQMCVVSPTNQPPGGLSVRQNIDMHHLTRSANFAA